MTDAGDVTARDLRVGLIAEYSREVGEDDVRAFGAVSGDTNPLHLDATYAAGTRLGHRVVHGAFQVGLASALAGMHLPGRRSLLTSIQARFPAPLYFPAQVLVRGEVTAWNVTTQSGTLRVAVLDRARAIETAEIVIGFTLHPLAEPAGAAVAVRPSAERSDARPLVLVTGASGGLGTGVVASLADAFDILALSNTRGLASDLRAPHISQVVIDMNEQRWVDAVGTAIGDRHLFAIVHAAWPGVPRGGLLTAPLESLQRQLEFATVHTIELARLLFARVSPEGGRMVALGSIAGQRKPALSAAAYSLGKGALEQTIRLLAPELARRHITVNAVCPSFVAAGVNRQADDRVRAAEASRVPMGRLCTPQDVAAMIQFLLSPGAAFVSGESIVLAGGQL